MKKILQKRPDELCDIIIPVWNQLEATRECVDSIIVNTRHPYRLILVDNASGGDTRDYLNRISREYPDKILVIRNSENLGFIKAVNQGIRRSIAPYVCVLNNDTLASDGWLKELVWFAAKHGDVGLLNPLCNGHESRGKSVNGYAREISKDRGKYMEMNQCQGFCMLVKREVLDKVGMLDERFGLGGFDDTDYSMRAHKTGYRCVCVHSAYVYHKEHRSFNAMGNRKKLQSKAEVEYFRKWHRHLRVALVASISRQDKVIIENILRSALYIARQWCWVNMLIFVDKNTGHVIEQVKRSIDYPLHQNLKFNILDKRFYWIEIFFRLLERSLGRKRRKKYDIVVHRGKTRSRLIEALGRVQGARVQSCEFKEYDELSLMRALEPFREEIKGNADV